MEAFRCDRCGKFYIPGEESEVDKQIVIFIDDNRLDLCAKCSDFLLGQISFNDGRKPAVNPNKRIDISEGLDPKTGEWGHNS